MRSNTVSLNCGVSVVFGMAGEVLIETREPPARHTFGAGQSASVTPPTVHHVSNPGSQPCRFTLVQGVGKYDFVKAD